MVGGNPKHDAYGFRHWKHGDYIRSYWTDGSLGNFLGWWRVFLYAAFSVAGPDLLALAAGEIQNPRRQIPRVAKRAFYRIAGFYIVGVFAVGILCSSHDEPLLGALEAGSSGAAASPWVIGIQNLGIEGLPSVINFLILLSAWSCGNAYLYAASRTLYSLALDGQAPQIFKKCTKQGIPLYNRCCTSLHLLLIVHGCEFFFRRGLWMVCKPINYWICVVLHRIHGNICRMVSSLESSGNFQRHPSMESSIHAILRVLGHRNRHCCYFLLWLEHIQAI